MSKDSHKVRRARIDYEIIVDCYDEDEVNQAWREYMNDTLQFPFSAKVQMTTSKGELSLESVEVTALDYERDGEGLYVMLVHKQSTFQHKVVLEDLQEVNADEDTLTAVEDWRFWLSSY